jgi:hypothetical protein
MFPELTKASCSFFGAWENAVGYGLYLLFYLYICALNVKCDAVADAWANMLHRGHCSLLVLVTTQSFNLT